MGVLHFRVPNHPGMRFEWHDGVKRVYLIREPTDPTVKGVHAEPIAYEITDHGAAQNAVLIYMRGFNEAKRETIGPK